MAGEIVQVGEVQAAEIIDYVPSFAITLQEARRRLEQLQQFIADQMIEGIDYGVIPGTGKKTLLKPGAEKLANIHGLAPHFEEMRCVEDWDKGFFYYVYRCNLINKRTGQVEAQCDGSCNSLEDKYRWRHAARTCPQCGKETIIKGKEEYGGGWLCWKRKGGCGAKFPDGDASIEEQEVGRIENDDPYSLVNTLQKMAQKRAFVGDVIIATRTSDIFTQDLEDMPGFNGDGEGQRTQKKVASGPAPQEKKRKPKVPPPLKKSNGNQGDGKHWVQTAARNAFWAQANEMGLSNDEVHKALQVPSVKDFPGTMQEALAIIQEWRDCQIAQEEGDDLPEGPPGQWQHGEDGPPLEQEEIPF